MLLPDNIHPDISIYYNGAIVLSQLNKEPRQKILDLYSKAKNDNNMSFPVFVLSLDWLYLIEAAEIDEEGVIRKCL